MAYPVITYVRTGQEELTEVAEGYTRVIDVAQVKVRIEAMKLENELHQHDLDWSPHDSDNLELSLDDPTDGFYAMEIEAVPETPTPDLHVVAWLGTLASLIRGVVR